MTTDERDTATTSDPVPTTDPVPAPTRPDPAPSPDPSPAPQPPPGEPQPGPMSKGPSSLGMAISERLDVEPATQKARARQHRHHAMDARSFGGRRIGIVTDREEHARRVELEGSSSSVHVG